MSILDKLREALDSAEANIVGTRYVKLSINGNEYSATASLAGSHQSANNWARTDYRKNGKRIAKSLLQATVEAPCTYPN